MNLKKIVTQGAIAGALGFTALGVGAGVANADQPIPSSPGMTWKLDNDDWDDWDDWNRGDWNRGDWNRGWNGGPQWNGPGYYGNGPCVWVPPAVSMWVPPAVC